MTKYKCQCCFDSIVEVKDNNKIPECCGEPMQKVNDGDENSENRCCCCIN